MHSINSLKSTAHYRIPYSVGIIYVSLRTGMVSNVMKRAKIIGTYRAVAMGSAAGPAPPPILMLAPKVYASPCIGPITDSFQC